MGFVPTALKGQGGRRGYNAWHDERNWNTMVGISFWFCAAVHFFSLDRSIVLVDAISKNATYPKSEAGAVEGERAAFPVLDFLFPLQSLDQAWEQYPLLATTHGGGGSANQSGDDDKNNVDACHVDNNSIRTVQVPPTVTFRGESYDWARRVAYFQALMIPDDILSIIFPSPSSSSSTAFKTPPPLQLGKDWTASRKIVRDGREWTGSLPAEYLSSPEQLQKAFAFGGFSIVIHELQDKWEPVHHIAKWIEEETLPAHVSCNMYLTPPPMLDQSSSDGSTVDNNKNHHRYIRQAAFEGHWDWMDVIVLQVVGEKVWSVAKRPQVELSTSDQKYSPNRDEVKAHLDATTTGERYDEIFLRPGDAMYIPRGFIHNASTVVDIYDDDHQQQQQQPSLHLTFGIEHRCQTTMEALIHHAIELCAARSKSKVLQEVAINAVDCPSPRGLDIPWKDVVHFAVAEVARRDATCSYHNATSCSLRMSIPFAGSFKDLRVGSTERQSGRMQEMLQEPFKSLASLADPISLGNFVHKLENGIGENIRSFCHPFLTQESTIPCPEVLSKVDRKVLVAAIEKVRDCALDNSDWILASCREHVERMRAARQNKIGLKLNTLKSSM